MDSNCRSTISWSNIVRKWDTFDRSLDLLSQHPPDRDDPRVRAHVIRLWAAIVEFTEQYTAQPDPFRPVAPKGKLLLIIETLKRSSITQRNGQSELQIESQPSSNITESLVTVPPPPPHSSLPPPPHSSLPPPPHSSLPPPPHSSLPPPPHSSLPPPPHLSLPPLSDQSVQKSQLKPLFWRRLQLTSAHLRANHCIWSHVTVPELSGLDNFVNLFARKQIQVQTLKSPLESRPSLQRPIRLLDGKRSQAVGILLCSIGCSIEELAVGVASGQVGVVDRETLQALHDLQGTREELARIRDHLSRTEAPPLDKPEMFLYRLSLVPQFSQRIVCILYRLALPEAVAAISDKLSMLSRVCHHLVTSPQLQCLLGVVLALGNVLNHGNKLRGSADGFHIDILPKLRDVKSVDNSSHLLQHVVASYTRTCGEQNPLPDSGDLLRAAQVDFDDLSSDLVSCSAQLESLMAAAGTIADQSFTSVMEEAISEGQRSLQELTRSLTASLELYKGVLLCYSMPVDTRPDQFFTIWFSFTTQFNTCQTEHAQKIAAEKLRVEEGKRRQRAGVRPASSSGLKARIRSKLTNNVHK